MNSTRICPFAILSPFNLQTTIVSAQGPPTSHASPQSNDVFVDETGLIYLVDRNEGLDILEFEGAP